MRILAALVMLGFGAVASPALADKSDYCAAYARDFADARSKDKPMWQHKYQIAQTACMAEPQNAEVAKPVPVKKAVPKNVAPPVIPPEPVVVLPSPPTPKASKLVAGTPAWNDYCSKKYTSFNLKTGTYTSRTGVERKCLAN
jgi:BA14K-like protein